MSQITVVPLAQCAQAPQPVYLARPQSRSALPSSVDTTVHKAASPTRTTLPHLPRLTAELCIVVPGSVGEVPASVVSRVHSDCINALDSSCMRNTHGSPARITEITFLQTFPGAEQKKSHTYCSRHPIAYIIQY